MAESEIKLIPENRVYAKPRLLTDAVMHFCPGCSHGTIHKLVAEVIDEKKAQRLCEIFENCCLFDLRFWDMVYTVGEN